MKKEDKEILLKDLSARLPYGVKCQRFDDKIPYALLGIDGDVLHIDCPVYDEGDGYVEIEYCKPYLRSLSSMTEEEKEKYNIIVDALFDTGISYLNDWLNSHHFDYRGLIPKGLALEATKDMYNF